MQRLESNVHHGRLAGWAVLLVVALPACLTVAALAGCMRVGPFRRPLLTSRFEVMAFAMGQGERGLPGSVESLKAHIATIDTVLDFGGLVRDDGAVEAQASPGQPATRDITRDHGKRLMLLVSNASPGGQGRTAMFEKARDRARTAQSLTAKVAHEGYDGLHLGFDRMPARVKPLYSAFVRDLANALHAKGKTLGVSVFPVVDMPPGTWGAFDYSVIGKEADYVVLCAYDRHDLATGPGAISPDAWAKAGLRKALAEIDPAKVLLGIGVYAYDWPQRVGIEPPEYLSAQQALQRAAANGAKITIDAASQQKTFRYRLEGTDRTVWVQDAYNVRSKINLGNKYGLRGIAIWRLGLEDDLTWSVVSSMHRE